MVSLSLAIQGAKPISRNLRLLAKGMGSLKDFYEDATEIVVERKDAVFENEGSDIETGPKRASLAASTENARTRGRGYYKNSPSKPATMRWTGNLQESTKVITTSSMGSVEMTAPYAKYHQKGGGKLPQRIILDIDNKTAANVVRALQATINKRISLFGLQA